MRENTPDIRLEKAAQLFRDRNTTYKDSYKNVGLLLKALFPDGITLDSEEDFNRFAVVVMIAGKLDRYFSNYEEGGHQDSLADLSVYAAMLAELDDLL